jgi:hypothetical protein
MGSGGFLGSRRVYVSLCFHMCFNVCLRVCLQSAKTKDVLPLVSQHAWSSASSLMVHGGEVDPNVFLACRNVHTLDFIPEKVRPVVLSCSCTMLLCDCR